MNEEELQRDILFQIDMQLYYKYNKKIAGMNDHLGDIYTYRDIEEVEQAQKDEKIDLLTKAIKELQEEIESRLEEIESLYKMLTVKDEKIAELEDDNNALEIMFDIANGREYRKKYIEERRKEQPNLYYPDFDEIYERYYKQKAEIEQMKEDYQILKDDIEGHRIVYVDTPEFEEKYISKDEIRHIRDKAECMDYYSLNGVIDDLTKLIGDENNE